MKQLHVVALIAVLGCNKGAKDEAPSTQARPQPKSAELAPAPPAAAAPAAPSAPSAAAPAPAAAGDSESGAPGQPFALFDTALAGGKPWLDDAGKLGIVELEAIDDASGRSVGTFKVQRRCGADAVAAVGAIGRRIAERAKAGTHDPARCIGDAHDTMTCVQGGNGEGDVGLEIVYRAAKPGAWRLVGVKTYAMGVTMDAQEAQFDKLAGGACPNARKSAQRTR